MGYHVTQRSADILIKDENKAAALIAVKALKKEDDSSYSWVTMDRVQTATTLEEALKAWRWETHHPQEDKIHSGDITHLSFTGQKLGDDKILFDTLAPYIEPGSTIEMAGEDDYIWRWYFNGRYCEEQPASLDWGDNEEIVNRLLEHKEILPTLIGICPQLDRRISEVMANVEEDK